MEAEGPSRNGVERKTCDRDRDREYAKRQALMLAQDFLPLRACQGTKYRRERHVVGRP